MATNMMSPGVEVTISDYSDYMADTSSSVIGIVGGARRGPTTPTLITSRDQALKTFGNPSVNDFGVYSLLAVLENANQVYYQRVVTSKRDATATINAVTFTGPVDYNDTHISIEENSDKTSYKVTITKTGQDAKEIASCTKDTIKTEVEKLYADLKVTVDSTKALEAGNGIMTEGAKGATYATGTKNNIEVSSKYFDSVLNDCKVIFDTPNFLEKTSYTLQDSKGNVLENFNSLDTNKANAGNADYFINYINKNSDYIHVSATSEDITFPIEIPLTGGFDGIGEISASDIVNGLEQFNNADTLEVDILLAPGWSDSSVISKGTAVCEERQDCIFLIDPLFGLSVQQVIDWSNCQGDYKRPDSSYYNSSYSAIYWPWVQIFDSFTNDYLWLPPSGYVASQFAYSDSVSEPWFAPAGVQRGKLITPVNIEYSPTKGERDQLYGSSNVVNPLVDYKSAGLVIWGQKTTLRESTALNRVNVRRLVNYIKKIVTNSTLQYVFEPNDEYCWEKWVDLVEPKLEAIKSQRGIYDYKIVMDSTTVTDDDIENNRMPGTIKIKPTKTAEFIPINFMIMPYNAVFNDEL